MKRMNNPIAIVYYVNRGAPHTLVAKRGSSTLLYFTHKLRHVLLIVQAYD